MNQSETVKVSVVIPIYNAERFLRPCLESLKNQTLKEIEIIMVNDGSTDTSPQICREYAEQDSRFRLITQENGGSAAARKTGMLAGKGEYFGFVDSDDWCEPDMYEKMYAAAAENDADIVFCNCYQDHSDGRRVECSRFIRNGFYDRKQIEEEILSRTLAGLNEKGNTHVIRWANYLRLYRRSMIEEHQIYNDPRFRRCQDLQLTFEATLYAQRYFYMGDEFLYHNRVVEGSQSRGYTKNQWGKLRILIERLYQDVDGYKELDLHRQMDLCAFFFAVYTCENESRPCEGLTPEDRRAHLQAICDDELTVRCLPGVPAEKLSKVNRAYYRGLQEKSVPLLEKANRMREQDEVRRSRISRILSVPVIKKIYVGIRKVI